MIITKTPFRMSFFGGGTDVPQFFEQYGGAVISTTFDKYCYVNVRHLPKYFDYKTELTYSRIERINNLNEIQHPAIREAMKFLDMHEIRLIYEADLPARSGLGTSSSFAVGMLNAFYSLKGKYVDKKRLAQEAIYLERILCNEAGGWQDQVAASYGGLNRINFKAGHFEVNPIIISPRRKTQLNNNLLLFFTGFSRLSSEIQSSTLITMREKISQLKEMYELVHEAESILEDENKDLDEFGRLLDYSWKLKKQTGNKISTNEIDQLYERAISAGALGGKLLGAGGGGFLLFYVQEDKRERVIHALNGFRMVPFQFEEDGTRVIYYTPENYLVELK